MTIWINGMIDFQQERMSRALLHNAASPIRSRCTDAQRRLQCPMIGV